MPETYQEEMVPPLTSRGTVENKGRMTKAQCKVKRPASMASNISSEFEEVHLEEVEHSASTGSGEEVEFPSGDDEVVQRQEPAVVGKNVSAPRPDTASTPGRTPDAAPAQQAANRKTPVKGEDADDRQPGVADEPEPEISWRGTRQGPPPNTVNAMGEPIYDPLKDIEFATQKATELASSAARNVSTRIMGGAVEAKQSLTKIADNVQSWQVMQHGATDAKDSLSKLANNVSTWWANLDPVPKPQPLTPGREANSVADSKGGSELQSLFGLPPEEELMEGFHCMLAQTYACTYNTFSRAREITFLGTLYVTDKHTCFSAPSEQISFCLAHEDITEVRKVIAKTRKPGPSEKIHIAFGGKEHVVFQGFKAADLTSALALLEHLTADS
ncbi:hypothetical protein WJX75_002334 [Coccomyxa subellipsoidea]|uniref:GRAM domain-containing protein n=1 Tax=Coccomyxa subellipsoidea TaxID=248742 RepID=A0ABR2YT56_9CHLO